jgi:hypothetical protein
VPEEIIQAGQIRQAVKRAMDEKSVKVGNEEIN